MSRRGFVKFANRPGKTSGFRASQARAATGAQRANVRAAARSMMAVNRSTANALNRAAAILTKKGVDTDLSLTPIIVTTNTNGSIFVCNLVQQGAGAWNRTGRRILADSLRISGFVGWLMGPDVTPGTMFSNFFRMVVVWDKQPSGAAIPTFDTIFGITAQDGTESCPDVLCPPKYDNFDRFQVLLDKRYTPDFGAIPATGTAPSLTTYTMVNEYLDLKGRETVFQGQSTPMTIADISSGALYVVMRAVSSLFFVFSLAFVCRSTTLATPSLASMALLVYATAIKDFFRVLTRLLLLLAIGPAVSVFVLEIDEEEGSFFCSSGCGS